MSVDDKTLMAFADGELSNTERQAVEAALAEDSTLREKLEAHKALRSRLSAAFDGILQEPVPDRLTAMGARAPAQVVDLAERRKQKWSTREWGAMAASVAVGLMIGAGAMNTQAPLIAAVDGNLVARGELVRALDTQLASDDARAVRIGLSFRTNDGGYCRTFDLVRSNTSGLACRGQETWNVAMTASGGGGEVRMAGVSSSILSAVELMIQGDPLDSADEREARARGWR